MSAAEPSSGGGGGGGGGSSLLVSHACQFCRKRKIKCDRLAGGCTHCKRVGNECVYPASQRKGRPRHGPNNAAGSKTSALAITSREARLLARIRELEGMLNQSADGGASPRSEASSRPADALNTISQGMDNLLVIDKKADYTDEAFWANLGVEVGDKDEPLDSELESDDEDGPTASTPLVVYSPSQSYISSSSVRNDLVPLHPSPAVIAYLWDAYVKNAEPILGLFHKPTVGRVVAVAQNDPSTLGSGDEVLLFSIYFAGLRTLTDEDIHLKFGADRAYLLEQFRSGIERGLAKADYLKPKGIASLQALTLYLVCLRYFEAPSMVWGLTGLALRIAQYMGLHRDGTNAKSLSPLEIEIRRRLWHQICLIDVRAAETLGFAPSTIETDTRVPLNIDDADISAESDTFPKPRTGMTEMSLAIMRIKFGIVYRRLISTRQVLTLAERVKMVEDYEQAMHREFLESKMDTDFIRNIADTAIKSLMWLGIYREERTLSQADKDRLFISAIQVIEMTHELHRDSGSKRWSWLFTSLIQYHAMTFTLGELCVRPAGEETERAWRALENSIHPWAVAEQGQKHLFQNVVRKLYTKAQKRRQMQQDGPRLFSYDTPPELNLMSGPPLSTMPPAYPPVTAMGASIPSMTDMPPMFMPFPQSSMEPDFVGLPEAANDMRPDGMAVPFPVQSLPHGAQMQNVPHDWAIWHDAFRGNAMNPNSEMYGNQQSWYPH